MANRVIKMDDAKTQKGLLRSMKKIDKLCLKLFDATDQLEDLGYVVSDDLLDVLLDIEEISNKIAAEAERHLSE